MAAAPKTVYDLEQFTLKDMTECGAALRKLGVGARFMEEVAKQTVDYLYETLTATNLQGKASALVRFFATDSFATLPDELQEKAKQHAGAGIDSETSCLVLLASRGIKPEWNDRRLSKKHQVMPLTTPDLGSLYPMVHELMSQLNVPVEKVVQPKSHFLINETHRNYNVFFVPDAANAPFLTDSKDFIVANGIKSVVGFGGLLPSGNLFSTILFLRTAVSRQTALAFRPFALNTKFALLPFDGTDSIFAPRKQ